MARRIKKLTDAPPESSRERDEKALTVLTVLHEVGLLDAFLNFRRIEFTVPNYTFEMRPLKIGGLKTNLLINQEDQGHLSIEAAAVEIYKTLGGKISKDILKIKGGQTMTKAKAKAKKTATEETKEVQLVFDTYPVPEFFRWLFKAGYGRKGARALIESMKLTVSKSFINNQVYNALHRDPEKYPAATVKKIHQAEVEKLLGQTQKPTTTKTPAKKKADPKPKAKKSPAKKKTPPKKKKKRNNITH